MKRLLFLIMILTSHLCSAQNYTCLQAGVKRYFVNANGYLRGVRIDSVRTVGSDVVYYPFHTPRGRYHISPMADTLDSLGGSWLGKCVIEQNDGTFLFDNIWHDTVVVKTHANLGDSWIFYNDTTVRYYRASVTSLDTMTVAGIHDSVKTITITAYDNLGPVPTDSVNNFKLILSKNNGFAQVFDLYTFPYHPPDSGYVQRFDYFLDITTEMGWRMSNSIFSSVQFANPTHTQLFDWSVGDVFEMARCNIEYPGDCIYRYQYYLDSFTNKATMPDGSVQYSYTGWLATWHFFPFTYVYNGHYPYDTVAISRTMTIPNTLVFDTSLMPEELNQPLLVNYYPHDATYCMTGDKYVTNPNEMSGNIWRNIHFESSGPTVTYKMGLGLVHYFYYTIGNPSEEYEDTTMQYYRRAGVPCGTYYDPPLVSVFEVHKNTVAIYPNPALNTLIIKSNFYTSYTAQIANMMGQVRITQQCNKQQETIDISDLPPGIYNISITDENGNRYNEKIVITH